MKQNLPNSYKDLISGYYGKKFKNSDEPNSAEDLFSKYYGISRAKHNGKSASKESQVMMLSCDDGEVLSQRRQQRSHSRRVLSRQSSQSRGLGIPDQDYVSPSTEINTDLAGPQPNENRARESGAVPDYPTPQQPSIVADNRNQNQVVSDTRHTPSDSTTEAKKSTSNKAEDEDDFEADIKAILSGKKVYDPASGKTVTRDEVSDTQKKAPPPPSANGDGQAIFDRIAQSMEYANAFDLGTVELQNRFSDFDRADDLRRQSKLHTGKSGQTETASSRSSPVKSSHEEFIKDLDAIRTGKEEDNSLLDSSAESLSLPASYVNALYGTGEHVMVAETMFPDKFLVGAAPGVRFSYGQIIAMADMFDSCEQMRGTSAKELQAIKDLVDQSTKFYKSGQPKGKGITSLQWNNATAKRYLRLAEDNYDHFAPNILFPSMKSAKRSGTFGDHKSAWEWHHKQALESVQKDSHSSESGYFPHDALIINAYGDHYLTDAFAAGHLLNKQAIIDMYTSKFYSGNALTSDGKNFFDKVAAKAFVGNVKSKFSKLQTVAEYNVLFHKFHAVIDSPSRFAELLRSIATREPVKVANLVVKALHDKLNQIGIDVESEMKPEGWHLTGDGHLTNETLSIMRQAVEQSIANVQDPGIRVSGFSIEPYFEKVWRYVPKLNPTSQENVKGLAEAYTNPKSSELVDAAADLITDEVDTLIEQLTDKDTKALQKI